ncbi:3-methyladenine DNA glycosylase AlkC [Neorhodopirellula lusitana]|uniref:3-methyladenine DNA glycosylase AlkC n=2 Tax=Neorhodopirellula lusitana TaxID=445327 RepID=A0ABY1PR58_9BACT|nr:3-methyladenine DNA glycosylase AlkC [Neorhodopirellula lusitana]
MEATVGHSCELFRGPPQSASLIPGFMKKAHRSTTFSLKDQLFNAERIGYLAGLFADADASFDRVGFQKRANRGLKNLELKQRIVHIAQALETCLDPDFRIAAKQILGALPPPLDPKRTDDDFGDFIFAPLGEWVVRNGLSQQYLRQSLRTLKQLTMRFSMEDAIRYFINAFPDITYTELEKWSLDSNYHVRRLVSEGTRPRLPWSGRLQTDPARPLTLLDRLHADSTRYVTRSVANHLNDLVKTEPLVVLDQLVRWQQLDLQDTNELTWMTRHALRTLVKAGNPDALKLLGFRTSPKIEVLNFQVAPFQVKPGEAIHFGFDINGLRSESLLIDYVIDFVKANGTRSPKVHKIKQINIERGETIRIEKRHPFRANATTFTLYPGTHRLTLQINGKAYGTLTFEMES